MTAWGRILDEYEANIARVEEAIISGEWHDDPTVDFSSSVPDEVPSVDEVTRYHRLSARADRCRHHLQAGVSSLRDDLDTSSRKRTAAHRYRNSPRF